MQTSGLTGGFSDPPMEASRVFRAALNALARPGHIETVASDASAPTPTSRAAAGLLLTLCDAETPLYLAPGHDGREMREWIAFHVGAPIVEKCAAMFALGRWEALGGFAGYSFGTPEYPDRAVTLIVEMDSLIPESARLTGPGIETEAYVLLPDAAAFARNHALYPLGCDVFLTSGDKLAGVPRSTKVETAQCT